MIRSRTNPLFSALLLVANTVSLAGCEGLANDGGSGTGGSGGDGAGGSGAGTPNKLCELTDDSGSSVGTLTFFEDRTLEAGCTYIIPSGFIVESGTLTVPAGVTLIADFQFAIRGGTLKLEGTEAEPVRVQVSDYYNFSPPERIHSGFLLGSGVAEFTNVVFEGQGEGPISCMNINGTEEELRIELNNVSMSNCLIAGIEFNESDFNLKGPFDKPQMPIKSMTGVTISDVRYGIYLDDSFMTPLPGTPTFTNVPSNFVKLDSQVSVGDGRRLQKTSLPWETQGFANTETIAIDAGVELSIRDEPCELDSCGEGDHTLANGEVHFDGTSAEPVIVRAAQDQTIGGFLIARTVGTHVKFEGPFTGNEESCALTFYSLDLTDSSVNGAEDLIALCVDDELAAARLTLSDSNYGFRLKPSLVRDLDGSNIYSNVQANLLEVEGGNLNLSGSHTWVSQGVPWYVTDGVQLLEGATLNLGAGIELEFAVDAGIHTLGDVVGNGTASAPINFSGDNYYFTGSGGTLSLTNAQFGGPELQPIQASSMSALSLTNVTFEPAMSIVGVCNNTTLVNTTVTFDDGC